MCRVGLSSEQAAKLMPMYVHISPLGHIVGAGGTVQKLFNEGLIGRRFLEVFDLERPREVRSIGCLRKLVGQKLYLRAQDVHLVGLAVQEEGSDALIINMSFGISVVDAVQKFQLTSADFAATDLAVEMLYLVEAKGLAMSEISDLNERLQGEKNEAEELAATDTLTGLKNRRAMDHYMARYIKSSTPFALMNMDLDFFKAVNDSLGHAAGDYVLRQVADVLRQETRDDDVVARVGGDEFVLLFKGLTLASRLEDIATRLIARLEQPIPYNGSMCRISCSLGSTISIFYSKPSSNVMLNDADIALYASKNKGRACHTIFAA
ncbi:GGDEF domain-containing protein [Falsihalocynthiibacter sp. SS001]|uniref:GGDEF domain-containing protein n=1 Tax=Falsihalocynthiibacter sp. SS001 TaxID=3349698 RepID=UPI0036D214D6